MERRVSRARKHININATLRTAFIDLADIHSLTLYPQCSVFIQTYRMYYYDTFSLHTHNILRWVFFSASLCFFASAPIETIQANCFIFILFLRCVFDSGEFVCFFLRICYACLWPQSSICHAATLYHPLERMSTKSVSNGNHLRFAIDM